MAMVSTVRFREGLVDKLPSVRGRLTANAPLGHMTWFGVGGPAEVLFRPEDREDLIHFVKNCPSDVHLTVLGVASNMIIRDGGIPGVVIRMGKGFNQINVVGEELELGSAVIDMNAAMAAMEHGIAGLEFLSGIPGTIGGALRMNAGAYTGETKNVLVHADVLERDGELLRMTPDEMMMSYRHNGLPEDVIFLSCLMRGTVGDKREIEARMAEIKAKRTQTQPVRSKTGGSTFANPSLDNSPTVKKAWQLIDEAGCRGLRIGGAEMSPLHCNFMINTGTATAADLERLGEEVRKRVYAHSKIMLRWEIKRVGVPLEKDKDILRYMMGE